MRKPDFTITGNRQNLYVTRLKKGCWGSYEQAEKLQEENQMTMIMMMIMKKMSQVTSSSRFSYGIITNTVG
jgi:ABC-type enterochelin transport system substrate-binding protein